MIKVCIILCIYSVILTEYVAMKPRECVCMYFCMCVNVYVCPCVCYSAAAQTDGSILMKLATNNQTDICEAYFSRIWTFLNR